jgi:ribosomal protein L40E
MERLIASSAGATLVRRVRTPEYCPSCGAEVPPRARACPECGADEHTGWSERAQAQRLDLPDEEFDYAEYVGREFGGRPLRRRGPQRLWWVVACLVLLAFLAMMLGRV